MARNEIDEIEFPMDATDLADLENFEEHCTQEDLEQGICTPFTAAANLTGDAEFADRAGKLEQAVLEHPDLGGEGYSLNYANPTQVCRIENFAGEPITQCKPITAEDGDVYNALQEFEEYPVDHPLLQQNLNELMQSTPSLSSLPHNPGKVLLTKVELGGEEEQRKLFIEFSPQRTKQAISLQRSQLRPLPTTSFGRFNVVAAEPAGQFFKILPVATEDVFQIDYTQEPVTFLWMESDRFYEIKDRFQALGYTWNRKRGNASAYIPPATLTPSQIQEVEELLEEEDILLENREQVSNQETVLTLRENLPQFRELASQIQPTLEANQITCTIDANRGLIMCENAQGQTMVRKRSSYQYTPHNVKKWIDEQVIPTLSGEKIRGQNLRTLRTLIDAIDAEDQCTFDQDEMQVQCRQQGEIFEVDWGNVTGAIPPPIRFLQQYDVSRIIDSSEFVDWPTIPEGEVYLPKHRNLSPEARAELIERFKEKEASGDDWSYFRKEGETVRRQDFRTRGKIPFEDLDPDIQEKMKKMGIVYKIALLYKNQSLLPEDWEEYRTILEQDYRKVIRSPKVDNNMTSILPRFTFDRHLFSIETAREEGELEYREDPIITLRASSKHYNLPATIEDRVLARQLESQTIHFTLSEQLEDLGERDREVMQKSIIENLNSDARENIRGLGESDPVSYIYRGKKHYVVPSLHQDNALRAAILINKGFIKLDESL